MDWVALPQLGAKSRWRQNGGTVVCMPSTGERSWAQGWMRVDAVRARFSPGLSGLRCGCCCCCGWVGGGGYSRAVQEDRGGGNKEVVSRRILPQPRPPRLPRTPPPRSACARIWGLVVQQGRLVLHLDCDKGGCKGIPGLGSAPARTQTASGWVLTGPGSGS